MEKIAFLIEQSGDQVRCLLNPESVVIRRIAGVRPRRSKVGGLINGNWSDDPLLYTGGGKTELRLDLLFDSSLLPIPDPPEPDLSDELSTSRKVQHITQDIREVTSKIWNLAENSNSNGNEKNANVTRIFWGKSWNIRGVITAVSERFEKFSDGGVPLRAWLQIQFLRVSEDPSKQIQEEQFSQEPISLDSSIIDFSEQSYLFKDIEKPTLNVQIESRGERLDQLAYRFYKSSTLWRKIALFNNVDNPIDIQGGITLQLPQLTYGEKK